MIEDVFGARCDVLGDVFLKAENELHPRRLVVIGGRKHCVGAGMGHRGVSLDSRCDFSMIGAVVERAAEMGQGDRRVRAAARAAFISAPKMNKMALT